MLQQDKRKGGSHHSRMPRVHDEAVEQEAGVCVGHSAEPGISSEEASLGAIVVVAGEQRAQGRGNGQPGVHAACNPAGQRDGGFKNGFGRSGGCAPRLDMPKRGGQGLDHGVPLTQPSSTTTHAPTIRAQNTAHWCCHLSLVEAGSPASLLPISLGSTEWRAQKLSRAVRVNAGVERREACHSASWAGGNHRALESICRVRQGYYSPVEGGNAT